jgi:hypothetical protein
MAFTKKITNNLQNNLRDQRKSLASSETQSSLFKRERWGDSQRIISNGLISQQALWNRRKRQGAIQRVQLRLTGLVHMSGTTVQTRVQCNIQCNANSTRSYENLSVSKLYQNCYKHCYNCETIDTKWHYCILAKSWKWLMKKQLELILGI